MADSRPMLVILGPTASGKSSVAMAVAQTCGAEILSLDSMQVYRGLDIGTAKPTPAERQLVRHHLLDLVNPDEPFTVARFVSAAEGVIADAAQRGVPLIATGGTPLYYKALFEGLFEGPSADAALRERLLAVEGERLHRRLAEVDPAAAQRIHANDTRRVVRALEVFELTGKPITQLQTEWGAGSMRHEAVWIGLDWNREALNRRINARVKSMLASGWLDEARRLHETFDDLSLTAGEATGYRQLFAHLSGQISLDDAAEQIKIATRQLARRQMKWLRRFPNVTWLAGDADPAVLAQQCIDCWIAKRPAAGAGPHA